MNILKLLVLVLAPVAQHVEPQSNGFLDGLAGVYNAPLLVCWSAEWCQYCHKDTGAIQQIRQDGKFYVTVLDYDKNKELARKYGVDRIPTYFIIKQGRLIYRTNKIKDIQNYQERE